MNNSINYNGRKLKHAGERRVNLYWCQQNASRPCHKLWKRQEQKSFEHEVSGIIRLTTKHSRNVYKLITNIKIYTSWRSSLLLTPLFVVCNYENITLTA